VGCSGIPTFSWLIADIYQNRVHSLRVYHIEALDCETYVTCFTVYRLGMHPLGSVIMKATVGYFNVWGLHFTISNALSSNSEMNALWNVKYCNLALLHQTTRRHIQKTVIFVFISVRTSNLTSCKMTDMLFIAVLSGLYDAFQKWILHGFIQDLTWVMYLFVDYSARVYRVKWIDDRWMNICKGSGGKQ
jgi:hypothetical protein